jgi:uncharacterized protein (TIGR03067 family)
MNLALIAFLFFVADEPKTDLDRLQGTWVMASLEVDGKLVPEEKIKGTTLTIKGDKYIVKVKDKTHEVSFKLDAKQNPRHMDMYFPDGKDAPKLAKGIYELKGDTLRICRAQPTGEDRPRDFVTEGVAGRFIVTWKKQE